MVLTPEFFRKRRQWPVTATCLIRERKKKVWVMAKYKHWDTIVLDIERRSKGNHVPKINTFSNWILWFFKRIEGRTLHFAKSDKYINFPDFLLKRNLDIHSLFYQRLCFLISVYIQYAKTSTYILNLLDIFIHVPYSVFYKIEDWFAII